MTAKLTKNILAVMIVAAMILTAIAAVSTDPAYADGAGYTYRVTVYSGNHGTFNGNTVWRRDYESGELVYITLDELGFKAEKDSKYYVRGFRISGHDNDESTGFQTLTFNITEDVAYEVAYGVRGSMVAYTARYLEKDTDKEVHAPDTFYGMPGDKPVISFRYVEGYEPDTYNIMQTLSEEEEKNVFTFYYTKTGRGGNAVNPEEDNGGDEGDAGNGGGNGPVAPGTAGNPAGTNVNNGRNIDNGPVPRAPGNGKDDNGKKQTTDIDKNKTPKAAVGMDPAILTGITAGILFLLLLLILFLLKRRNSEKEEDDA